MNGWISVKDRLPDNGEFVIVETSEFDPGVCGLCFDSLPGCCDCCHFCDTVDAAHAFCVRCGPECRDDMLEDCPLGDDCGLTASRGSV